MFSIKKEYIFDAKRGSFLHEKDMFFKRAIFSPKDIQFHDEKYRSALPQKTEIKIIPF